MSSQGDSPRAKMINLMYLVLTAMLSLTVSQEVMNAFSVVNDSIISTNEIISRKLQDAYTRFERDYQLNKTEVGPFIDKANEAKRLSGEIVSYIKNLRDEITAETEKIPLDSVRKISVQQLKNKDDYITPTRILIGSSDNGSNGKSRELKNKIEDYKEKMLNLVDPKYRDQINIGLKTEGEFLDASGEKQSWEVHNFYDIPLAADIAIFNKIITDVSNAEFDIVNILHQSIDADDFKYECIEAQVLTKANYIFTGDQYEAEVIVAAYDTSQGPKVYLMRGVDSLPVSRKDEAILIPTEKGRIKLKFPAVSAGNEKYAGFVSVRNSSGTENTYHFNNQYVVATPSLAISATKMNVLYIGVENPLSISVSGIPLENLIPSISCGVLKKNPQGQWTANVPDGCKQAKVILSVKLNGGIKTVGSEFFRIKKLPDPEPFVANVKNGFISRDLLISDGNITARMPKDFEFDYSFEVRSFRMSMQRGFNLLHFDSNSNKLTEEMIKQIKNTNRGQTIIFEQIIARSPEGADRMLSPLIITIS